MITQNDDYFVEAPSEREFVRVMFLPPCLLADFFNESDYAHFTSFDPTHGMKVLLPAFRSGALLAGFAYPRDEEAPKAVGLVVTTLLRLFSADATANLFFFYVTPELRSNGIGRLLLEAAEIQAADAGAKALFLGAGAGIRDTDEKFLSLALKMGYEKLGAFGRKVLQ